MTARCFQDVVAGCNLEDDRHVPPRANGNSKERKLHTEDLERRIVETEPVVGLLVTPGAKLDDHLYRLLVPHGARAEEIAHVDDPNPANLEMISKRCRRAAEDLFGWQQRQYHLIVRNESVPPFDEEERTLTLANAARSQKESPDPVYIHQDAMAGHGWGEDSVEYEVNRLNRTTRTWLGNDERSTGGLRGPDERRKRFDASCQDDQRQPDAKEDLQPGRLLWLREGLEERHLGLAEDLNSSGNYPVHVTGESKSRLLYPRMVDRSAQTIFARNEAKNRLQPGLRK